MNQSKKKLIGLLLFCLISLSQTGCLSQEGAESTKSKQSQIGGGSNQPFLNGSCTYSQNTVYNDTFDPTLSYPILSNASFVSIQNSKINIAARLSADTIALRDKTIGQTGISVTENFIYTPPGGGTPFSITPQSFIALNSTISLLSISSLVTATGPNRTLIRRSTNSGVSYSTALDIQDKQTFGDFSTDYKGNVYIQLIQNSNELLKSTDSGASWTVVNKGAFPAGMTSIGGFTASRTSELFDVVYSNSQFSVRKSLDQGSNWQTLNTYSFATYVPNPAPGFPGVQSFGTIKKLFEDRYGYLYIALEAYEGFRTLNNGTNLPITDAIILRSQDRGVSFTPVFNLKSQSLFFGVEKVNFFGMGENIYGQKYLLTSISDPNTGISASWQMVSSSQNGITWTSKISSNFAPLFGSGASDLNGNIWMVQNSGGGILKFVSINCNPTGVPNPNPTASPTPTPTPTYRYGDAAGNCINLNTWITTVKTVAVNRCVSCHANNPAFIMNVNNNAAMCKEFLLRAQSSDGDPLKSTLIEYPLFSGFHANLPAAVQGQVIPAWINWINSEKN